MVRQLFPRLVPLVLLVAVVSVSLHGQTRNRKPLAKEPPPSAFKLISIQVSGNHRFPAPDIIAESGLQLGQPSSEEDFQHASRRLGETGAFSDVSYKYEYSPAGAKLEFQVTEKVADQFAPARFDNLVWISDQELQEKLHAGAPLFHGELPLDGSLSDQVLEVLQALLVERKVPGRLDYLRAANQNGPISAIVFTITGPSVRIGKVDFSGAGAEELPALQAAAKELARHEYLRSILDVQAEKVFLPIFLQHGYLKTIFAEAQAKIVQADAENQEVLVDVTFPVTPGLQYKLADVRWSGNKIFPTDKLQPLIQLHTGQPANAVELDNDLEAAQKLYGTRGYVAAHITAVPHMSDADSTVRYELQVQEGDLYHMGELEVQGLDSQTRTKIVEAWKLRAGEPYDSNYLRQFIVGPASQMTTAEWKITIHEAPNPTDKTVDVTLRFDAK